MPCKVNWLGPFLFLTVSSVVYELHNNSNGLHSRHLIHVNDYEFTKTEDSLSRPCLLYCSC